MLYHMYLFNAWLNKYKWLKCCIIVAKTYGAWRHLVVVVIVSCWGDAASCGSHAPSAHVVPQRMRWSPWIHACVPHTASGTCGQGRACSNELPVAWWLYVGVARPLPDIPEVATVCQGRQRLIPLSALWVTATCHAYTTLSKLCL